MGLKIMELKCKKCQSTDSTFFMMNTKDQKTLEFESDGILEEISGPLRLPYKEGDHISTHFHSIDFKGGLSNIVICSECEDETSFQCTFEDGTKSEDVEETLIKAFS